MGISPNLRENKNKQATWKTGRHGEPKLVFWELKSKKLPKTVNGYLEVFSAIGRDRNGNMKMTAWSIEPTKDGVL